MSLAVLLWFMAARIQVCNGTQLGASKIIYVPGFPITWCGGKQAALADPWPQLLDTSLELKLEGVEGGGRSGAAMTRAVSSVRAAVQRLATDRARQVRPDLALEQSSFGHMPVKAYRCWTVPCCDSSWCAAAVPEASRSPRHHLSHVLKLGQRCPMSADKLCMVPSYHVPGTDAASDGNPGTGRDGEPGYRRVSGAQRGGSGHGVSGRRVAARGEAGWLVGRRSDSDHGHPGRSGLSSAGTQLLHDSDIQQFAATICLYDMCRCVEQVCISVSMAVVGGFVQDRMQGAAGAAPRQDDYLLSVDDDLDAHPAMLPTVQLMERGAALWEQVRSIDGQQTRAERKAENNVV